jgi:hypothetical protein
MNILSFSLIKAVALLLFLIYAPKPCHTETNQIPPAVGTTANIHGK